MKNATRFAAVLALISAVSACDPPTAAPIALPAGLAIADLDADHRRLLRATLAIDGGLLDETTVVLDVDDATLRADVVLGNVGSGGARLATLRVYGRDTADSDEVLLGTATDDVTITPAESVYVDFKDSTFDICGVGVDGKCGLALDRNRNGRPNIDDLIAGIDPGPSAPFLQVSPSTLQFSSGIRLGDFGRQVIVTENLGDHPVRIDLVQVAGGQGMGVALFNPDAGSTDTPRRRIELAQLDSDGDGVGDVILAPGEELFVAVSFAPVNSFLTTAAVQIVATDVVTGVSQGSRTKVIANSDGALRPRDPRYVGPAESIAVDVGAGSIDAAPFPVAELFSGAEITAPAGAVGLAHSGSSLVIADRAGDTLSMPADAAFVVDVAAGQRFTAALASAGDIDIALLELSDAGDISVLSTSRQQGESAEAVELFNGGDASRRLVVVLGRIDLSAPIAVAGALVADAQPLPFRLSCQLTKGPELDDVTPISPVRGPLEGGSTVTLRGRGFYMPATSAGPHARVSFNGVASISTPQITKDEAGDQTIVVVLPPGGAAADVPVTVVVENPSSAGGDGQAATLPEGFRYDLPRARLSRISPDVTTTTGGTIDVLITGAFFFNTHGAPQVLFGDIPVEGVVVDSATILVRPPAHAAGDVEVTVSNALVDGSFGDASEPLDFRFVQPTADPPTLTSISPATGSALGGDRVDVVGTGFVDGSRVLLGGNDAEVTSGTATQLSAVTRPVSSAGSVDVVVVNPDGQVAVLRAAYTFTLPAPAITAVIPDRASTGGNAIVVVNGEGFRDDTVVFFENDSGSVRTAARAVSRSSSTTLLVTTPSFAAGTGKIVVENVDGQRVSSAFSFLAPQGAPPTIQSISPSSGTVAGGTLVSITASATRTPTVVFGGVALAADAVVSEPAGGNRVTLKVRSPAGALGTTAVTVINADGQSASTSFTYVDERVARIVGVRPAFVHARLAGDELLVFGEHFSSLGPVLSANALHGSVGRTPLAVVFSSDGFANVAVGTALPEGPIVIELVGAAGAVRSAPISARAPDIALVTKTNANLVITGTDLAGALLRSVRVNGATCVITTADERAISCNLVGDGGEGAPVFELGYGADVITDDSFVIVEDGDFEGCEPDSCNGQACETDNNGQAVCLCNPGFDPQTECQPCQAGSNSPSCQGPPPQFPRSCSELPADAPSGTFQIDVDGFGPIAPRSVFCDMDFDNGGWTRVGASSSNGFSDPTVVFVFSVEEIRAIAESSSQVHIRTATTAGAPEVSRFVTSRPGTTAIQNLRVGNALIMTQENKPNDYVGTMLPNLSVFGCTPPAVWPVVYHACGNAGGLHFFLNDSPSSRWDNFGGSPHEPMEVYVRAAPVPQSCAELQEREPGLESGEFFVGNNYQFCDFDEDGPGGVGPFVVTTGGDNIINDGLCSLREALTAIETGTVGNSGCDGSPASATAVLLANVTWNGGPVFMSKPFTIEGGNNQVLVSSPMLQGVSAQLLDVQIVQQNPFDGSLFQLSGAATLSNVGVEGVTFATSPVLFHSNGPLSITGGRFSQNQGSVILLGNGSQATIFGSRFDGNVNSSDGGVIRALGDSTLTVRSSLFIGNGGNSGGAIAVDSGASAELRDSVFIANTAALFGGALSSSGNTRVIQSTFKSNTSLQFGGGIAANGGALDISSSTIAYNRSTSSNGGLGILNGTVRIKDSIVANNAVGVASPDLDCGAQINGNTVTFVGNNIIKTPGRCLQTNQPPSFEDPGLLAPVGFPDALATSASEVLVPAPGFARTRIVGDCTDLSGALLGVDARGVARNGSCDVGAVQLIDGPAIDIIVDSSGDETNAGNGGCTLRGAVLAAASNAAIDGCIAGNTGVDRIVFAENIASIFVTGTIPVDGAGTIVIDGIANHAEDIVTIVGSGAGIFEATAPFVLRGVELVVDNAPANVAGIVMAEGSPLRIEQTTIFGGAASGMSAIAGNNASVTIFASTISPANGNGADGEALLLTGNSNAVLERSTIVTNTDKAAVRVDSNLAVRLRQVSIRGADQGVTPLIGGVGVVTLQGSIIEAGSRKVCEDLVGSVASTDSIARNCNGSAFPQQPLLTANLEDNGGRTPTIATSLPLPFAFAADCNDGESDQRGLPQPGGGCEPGAYASVGLSAQECGDGFVDVIPGLELEPRVVENMSGFDQAPVIGSGRRNGDATLIIADRAGSEYLFCDTDNCTGSRVIGAGAIAAIGVANTSGALASEQVTIIDTDGRIRVIDDSNGDVLVSEDLDTSVIEVIDAVFFKDLGSGGDDIVVTGVNNEGLAVINVYDGSDGSLNRTASFSFQGEPLPGISVSRRADDGIDVQVLIFDDFNGSVVGRLVTVRANGTAFETPGGHPGMLATTLPATATLVRGRNGQLWSAQNQPGFIRIARDNFNAVSPLPGITATSVVSADLDNDGNDEVIAVDNTGTVLVYEERTPNAWVAYDDAAFAGLVGEGGGRCQVLDAGDTPTPELVCVINQRVRILSFRAKTEQCDVGNPFGAPCTPQCLFGQPP